VSEAPVVVVVGLQKSGTTPLMRLLTATSAFRNPVKFEGRELWGDDPPFSPEAFPAGTLYQRDGGRRGHELDAADATPEAAEHVRAPLRGKGGPDQALVLKNPYNTVRLGWVGELLPQAHVVAIVRRPLPNVFSLLKKHVPNPTLHRGPEEGWWGVKPDGWRDLVGADKLVQCAHQWDRVNARLAADLERVDTLVAYHELCADPASVVERIARATIGSVPDLDPPRMEALDEEFSAGGPLESANRVFKRTGSLDLAGADRDPELLEPLSERQRAAVTEICGPTAAALGL
jgi:hypothetical protein